MQVSAEKSMSCKCLLKAIFMASWLMMICCSAVLAQKDERPNAYIEFNLTPNTVITGEMQVELDPLSKYCWIPPWHIEETEETIAELTYVFGIVHVTSADGSGKRLAKHGDMLKIGDVVETSRRSKAEITYRKNLLISMNPMTKLSVPADYKKPKEGFWNTLKLFFGFIYVQGRTPDEFNIQTPRAVVGVRGTSFWIDLTEKSSDKIVLQGGSLEIVSNHADKSSSPIKLAREKKLVVLDNASEVSALSGLEIQKMNREFVLAGSKNQPELELLIDLHELRLLTPEQQNVELSQFVELTEVKAAVKSLREVFDWLEKKSVGSDAYFSQSNLSEIRKAVWQRARDMEMIREDLEKQKFTIFSHNAFNVILVELTDFLRKSLEGLHRCGKPGGAFKRYSKQILHCRDEFRIMFDRAKP